MLNIESENMILKQEISKLEQIRVELEEEKEVLINDKDNLEKEKIKLNEENTIIKKELSQKREAEKLAKTKETKEKNIVADKPKDQIVTSSAPTRAGGRTRTFTATAYDLSVASCGKGKSHPQYGITASGYSLKGHSRTSTMTIAVDPRVIPLGTVVYVEFAAPYTHFNGNYTARDTGGAIKGNIIDIFMGEGIGVKAVNSFGKRQVKVTF